MTEHLIMTHTVTLERHCLCSKWISLTIRSDAEPPNVNDHGSTCSSWFAFQALAFWQIFICHLHSWTADGDPGPADLSSSLAPPPSLGSWGWSTSASSLFFFFFLFNRIGETKQRISTISVKGLDTYFKCNGFFFHFHKYLHCRSSLKASNYEWIKPKKMYKITHTKKKK